MKQKIKIALTVFFFFQFFAVAAQNNQTSFKLLSWNIEWFGSPANGPQDLGLQETNVVKVLKQINADIMGFCEVVDTFRFRRVCDSLGSGYNFKIADFCSNNTTGTGNGWLTGQKLGFIYKKSLVSNVSFRGFMRSSSSAYTNFSSGRFPYLMNADVTLNGITKNINFFLIHGKAEGSPCAASDYNKKYAAAKEMKDSLDLELPNALSVIVGDYNDDLKQTISTCAGSTLSSYDPIIKDSANYKSITLPLSRAGLATMINYPNVIDNHIASTALYNFYIANSVHIASDVTATIPNYAGNNTSDHYPVYSIFSYTGIVTAIPTVDASDFSVRIYPNPVSAIASVYFGKTQQSITIELATITGNKYWTKSFSTIYSGETIQIPMNDLPHGMYVVKIRDNKKQTVIKLIK